MSNPIDLIKNGDFVEVINKQSNKKEYYLVLTDWYGKILFVKDGDQYEYNAWFQERNVVSKIFRYRDGHYNLKDGLEGDLNYFFVDVIYDRSNDVLELTVKQIEEKFGCKVKIVKEN